MLQLFPFCSPAVGEDSLGEPPMDSYGLATAYPKQQQQHIYTFAPAHRSGGPHHQTGIYNMGETLVLWLVLHDSSSSSLIYQIVIVDYYFL